jgi:hypothetical protein
MQIRPVGAELFHADRWTNRQTVMTKLIVAFRNFANAAKTVMFQGKPQSRMIRLASNLK